MKPLILHISNDYPDPLKSEKTPAIMRLVEATPEYRHVVYSLNRTSGLRAIASLPFGEDRTAVAYGALPKGFGWRKRLLDVAHWIEADLKEKNIIPHVIQAHKITVEGIVGLELARRFGCKLICDVQGTTDLRILKLKSNFRRYCREIVSASSLIFPYAPWVMEPLEKFIGLPREKCTCLPVLPGFELLNMSPPAETQRLITLMRFDDQKNKNIAGILGAMRQLTEKYPTLTLDIYGGGSAEALLKITHLIHASGIENRVTLKGPIANSLLPQVMGNYSALVVPSFLESYGLVYAEALLCGVPVLFSKGRAIDGYFDSTQIGYACDPTSVTDIAAGIDHLLKHETKLKAGIAELQRAGAFHRISRTGIIETYRKGLATVLAR